MKTRFSLPLFSLLLLSLMCLGASRSGISASASPDLGVFYYPWFKTGAGVDTFDVKYWNYPGVQDQPSYGFYASDNVTVISRIITDMRFALIDFAISSWWGVSSYTDNNTKVFFECLRDNYTPLKACVMVEPFNGTESQGRYNYTAIYDYVYDSFVVPFESCHYTRFNGWGVVKPVIAFYNAENFTVLDTGWTLDDRFEVVQVGHKPYVEWVYHDIVEIWRGNYNIPQTRQYPVCPRYDDKWLNRSGVLRYDVDYSNGSYLAFLKSALRLVHNNTIDLVTVCTWNEYNERTQIEPHLDRDFQGESDYLLNLTREYAHKFKGLPYDKIGEAGVWYNSPLTFGFIIMGVFFGVLIIKKW